MHRFDRMHLSAEVTLRTAESLDLEEKSKLAEGIAVLAVIDHRRDYLAAGYSSTLDYCMDRLHLSQDRALKRIQVARAAREFPQVFEHLADGRLSVSTASVLAPHLAPETAAELLAAAAFRSRQEILRLLAERSRPVAARPTELAGPSEVQDTSGSYAPGHTNSLSGLLEPPGSGTVAGPSAPADVSGARRGRITHSANGAHEARLSLTDEEHQHFRRAQTLLGHAVPSGDPALIYARAMKHYVAHLEKQGFGVQRGAHKAETASPKSKDVAAASGSLVPERVNSPRGRGLPKSLRRQVWERDGGCCAFVSADGHRCGSTTRLEVDHITPVAHGGRTEPENLRLLCRAHNQFEAERVLGKEHVQTQRQLAQRGRARARAASEAGANRARAAAEAGAARTRVRTEDAQDARVMEDGETEARAAAKQARNDDLRTALRGLGFTVARAKWGVEMADTMPDAPLETCLRHALTELTRSVAMRGERRVSCSA